LKVIFESELNVDLCSYQVKRGFIDIDFQQPCSRISGRGSTVIVCHCFRVSDRQVRRAVADGACDLAAVSRACGAGAGCGGCRPEVADIVSRELGEGDATGARSLLPILRAG